MFLQQIKFKITSDNGTINDYAHGGILVTEVSDDPKDNYIICGDCGGIIEIDEAEIITKYNDWMDLSEAITGEEGWLNDCK